MAIEDHIISRQDATSLIPVEVATEIINGIRQNSAALKLLRKLPNMSRKQYRMPVLSALVTAGFVNGDTGLKSVSKAEWKDKFITAEEIAVIIPVPEAVLDDAEYNIFAEIKPLIEEAFGVVIDGSIFFGVDAPTSWPMNIYDAIVAAGNLITVGTGIDFADDVNLLMAKVEACGFDVTGFAAAVSTKSRLRGLRTNDGALLYQPSLTVGTPGTLYGQTIDYPKNGAWDAAKAAILGGDFSQAVYSMRQDITYKVLDQATLTLADGTSINLAQQDMKALRCVLRMGWQVPNPINRLKPDEAARYPFAAITA